MSRLVTSILPAGIGAFLVSPLLSAGYSTANIVNLFQVIVGFALIGYGALRWSAHTRSPQPPPQVTSPAPAAMVRSRKTVLEKYYRLYVKYLVILPVATASVSWALSFKLAGCKMSGASMQIYDCGALGRLGANLFLYSALFAGAMLVVFVPLTVVYFAHAASEKPRK